MNKEKTQNKEETPTLTDSEENEKTIDLNEVLETIEPEKRDVIARAFVAMQETSFSGPLPSPDDFKKYGDVVRDAPERILVMAEKQLTHRVECENKIIASRIKESKTGQWMGFILALIFIAVALFLGYKGHDWLAGTIIVSLISIAIVFVLKKNPKESNDNESSLQKD